ncbi:MAG: ABC transporter substrate-binding protein [Alphaproteobacteria bacterium]|nr:ABC transporter substrate-binding protein [Alphaproteobacteria bacterium]
MTVRSRLAHAGLGAACAIGTLLLWASPGLTQAKSTLRVVPHADLRLVDPVATVTLITRMHGTHVYEALFAWDSKFESKPMMVESYSVSPDNLTYRFTLRQGLKFHDGQPVTVDDVIPSIQRWMKRGLVGGKLGEFVSAFEKVDDRTFVLKMKEPFGATVFLLGGTTGTLPIIMRKKDAANDAFQNITDTVGSGPFRFVTSEWVPGSKVVYEKNPDYMPRSEPSDGLAGARIVKVDRVEYTVIPDPSTAVAALSRGEVDFLDQPRVDLLPQLRSNKDVVIDTLANLDTMAHMRPNHLLPPFNNPKVRLALAAAIHQPDFMIATVGDDKKLWQECRAYYVCGGPNGTDAGAEDYRVQNVAKAKQLLSESGYKGEKVLLLSTNDIPIIASLAQVANAQLKAAGFNVEMAIFDWGAVVARTAKKDPVDQGGWNLFVTTAGGVYAMDPLLNTNTDMSCDGRNNVGWPCDQEVERLRDRYIRATDPAQKKEIMTTLHKRLWETQPTVLLGQFNPPSAWRANVKGVLKTPITVFWNISKS